MLCFIAYFCFVTYCFFLHRFFSVCTPGVLLVPVPNTINIIVERKAEREGGKDIDVSVLLTPNIGIKEKEYRLSMDTNFDIAREGEDVNKNVYYNKHQQQTFIIVVVYNHQVLRLVHQLQIN